MPKIKKRKPDARDSMDSLAGWCKIYGYDRSNARNKKGKYEEITGETLGVYKSHNWWLLPDEAKAFFEGYLKKKRIK